MPTLITGGAGFIGSHLADALSAQGLPVTVLDNLSSGRLENITALMERPGFRFVEGDVRDASVLGGLVAEADAVYHLAAAVGVEMVLRDPVHTIETNVLGTENVLRAARRTGCKVLIASSSEVYGKSETIPYLEDGDRVLGPTTKSRWSYAESKALDEHLALAYHHQFGLPVVIGRFFNTVGPRQTGYYGMVIPRLACQAVRGEPLTVYGDGQQTRCFCDVRDVVRALQTLMAAPQAVGEIVNIGGDEEITIQALAERIRARANSDVPLTLIPYDQAYDAGFEDTRRRVPSIAKIQALIGWRPTIPFDQTLDDVIAQYR